MSKNKNRNRRAQTPKGTGENRALVNAMQGKRRSNAAGPHRTERDYRRKPKHFQGWDQ